MDALSTLIEEGRPEWYEALCGYCDGKAASWTFAALDPGGGRAKERLLAALWAALGRADRDSAGVFRGPGRTLVLVHAVRLLLREDGDIRPVAGADVLAYFLRAADLVPRDAAAERGADRSAAVTLEALKVVINLVTKVDANRVLFVQQHHAEVGLLARLRATTAPGQDDMLFLLYRLLAQVTCDETNACIVRAIGDSDALRLCERDVCSVTVFDAHGTENALMPQFIHEAYTAVFNLTLHLGRLKGQRTPPTPTELAVFKKLSVNMDLILQTRSEQLKLLRQAVASCLINSPQGWEHVVDPAGLARSVRFFLAAVRDGVGSSPYQLFVFRIFFLVFSCFTSAAFSVPQQGRVCGPAPHAPDRDHGREARDARRHLRHRLPARLP